MENKFVLEEKKRQKDFWFLLKTGNYAFFLLMFLLLINKHECIVIFGILLQGVIFFLFVPKKIKEFEERLKHITFKTQIFNLFVYPENPNSSNEQTIQTFHQTIEYLKTVGNVHEVRVYLILYRDVKIFCYWHDSKGNLQKESFAREEGATWQTWDEFLNMVEMFKNRNYEEQMRRFRSNNVSFDWVNENVFYTA